jgi:ferritin-like metal-binding protein YciE
LPVAAGAAGAAAFWAWRRRRRSVRSLKGLLIQTLADLRATEIKSLPVLDRMRRTASNRDLANLFTTHHEETKGQIERLDRALRSIGEKPPRGNSSAIAALRDEAGSLLKRKANGDVRDASLIAIAQRAEHLEIAGYGTARTFALTLGYTYAAELLDETLEEERAMDAQLTSVAERFVNLESIR